MKLKLIIRNEITYNSGVVVMPAVNAHAFVEIENKCNKILHVGYNQLFGANAFALNHVDASLATPKIDFVYIDADSRVIDYCNKFHNTNSSSYADSVVNPKFINAAAYSHNGTHYFNEENLGSSYLSYKGDRLMRVQTLDSIIEQYYIGGFDILVIDTNGSEEYVWAGFHVAKHIPTVVILPYSKEKGMIRVYEELKERGYKNMVDNKYIYFILQ